MRQETIDRIRKFSEDRDWDQFHSPANLAKSISIEANELLECFQWDDQNYDLKHVKMISFLAFKEHENLWKRNISFQKIISSCFHLLFFYHLAAHLSVYRFNNSACFFASSSSLKSL